MDSAIIWILAWSGVVSIAIYALTGLPGQLIPLIDAWRSLFNAFRDDDAQNAPHDSESFTLETAVRSAADPAQLGAAGSAADGERRDELGSATPAPPSHQ
ncbi:hypothetical protein [Streptomyces sp. Qhu_M48]|uniref:hypothetical protein n=1 Tax=Streptomyces sp. Qhu_M48 TaxID=3435889 RepID=UPI003F4FC61F